MPRRRLIRVCTGCGTLEAVNKRSKLCPTCAIDKHRESVYQLQQKQGPIYEKWRAGLMRHLKEVDESG